jgi:hypothetical protein
MQAAGLGLAAGVERMAVYKLYDQELPPGGESFGILSPADRTRRPAFLTWQAVTRHLNDVESARRGQTPLVDSVLLAHEDDRQSLLAWARTAESARITVEATGSKAHLVDQYGTITLLHPTDGVYTLSLPGATCNAVDGCAVGGPVWLLIQPAGRAGVRDITTAPIALVYE